MENLFSKYSSAFTHRSVTKILDVAFGPNKVIEPSVSCLSICLQMRVCVRAEIRSKLVTTEHLCVQAALGSLCRPPGSDCWKVLQAERWTETTCHVCACSA